MSQRSFESFNYGCDKDTRAAASLERSIMEAKNIYDHKKYDALSGPIHCQNFDNQTKNCPNAIKAKPYLPESANKKK